MNHRTSKKNNKNEYKWITILVCYIQSLTKLLARTKRLAVATPSPPSPPFQCCMQPKWHVKGGCAAHSGFIIIMGTTLKREKGETGLGNYDFHTEYTSWTQLWSVVPTLFVNDCSFASDELHDKRVNVLAYKEYDSMNSRLFLCCTQLCTSRNGCKYVGNS